MQLPKVLMELGLTEVESAVYVFLLQESPATGYRAAQAIGRPLSQTYKAIEALARKGAVLVDDGATRLCTAVSPDDFVSQIQQSFAKRLEVARQLFRQMPKQPSDHRVYQIESYDEVVERSIRMLHRVRRVAIVDVFPAPLAMLRKAIERASDRGKHIALKTYEPTDVRATLKTVLSKGQYLMEMWPGEILNVVIDGTQFLSALIHSQDREVLHAIWSSNPFLAARQHNGLSCEIGLTLVQSLLMRNAPKKELNATLETLGPYFLYNSPGFKSLRRKS